MGGIIGYKGKDHDNPRNITFYGIELLNGCCGNSDGQYKGKRYFQTLPDRAIFVSKDKIRRTMIGKDYNAPKRLDRRQSLQHRQSSSVLNQKQTEYELAIFDVAKELETKCNILDDIKEEQFEPEPLRLQNNHKSSPENVVKTKKRKKGRKKEKAKSLALSAIRRKYEENAKNIDNERNKKIQKFKKRKSFNRVKLDQNVKNKAIAGFKKKKNRGVKKKKKKKKKK